MAGEGANEEEEDLKGADPGDGAGVVAQGGDEVGLENPEGVYVAPSVEDYEVAHDGLRPGCDAAVWRGPGSMKMREMVWLRTWARMLLRWYLASSSLVSSS